MLGSRRQMVYDFALSTPARDARGRYDASLEVLRKALASFPTISQQLGAQEERLAVLEKRVAGLRKDIDIFERGFGGDGEERVVEKPREILSLSSPNASIKDGSDNAFSYAHLSRPSLSEPPPSNLKTSHLVASEPAGNAGFGSSDEDDESFGSDSDGIPELPLESDNCATKNMPAARNKPAASVSFGDDEELSMVREFSVNEFQCNKPAHGHWLPTTVMDKRNSFKEAPAFAKQIGGRTASLPTGSDIGLTLDCVLVEPMGKILSPDDYKSAGLIICIQSQPYLAEDDEEWGQLLKKTKWLDAGFSVCFPDLWRGSGFEVEDLHVWLDAVMARVGADQCVLLGKGWGGHLAVQLAHSAASTRQIVGLILVAPGHLPSEASRPLEVPALLLWAVDDEVCPYEEYARDWARAMERWSAPTAVKRAAAGGHDMRRMLQESRTSLGEALLHFCVAALIVDSFERWTASPEEDRWLDDRVYLLLEELPSYFAKQMCSGVNSSTDDAGGFAQAVRTELSDPQRGCARAREKVRLLRTWIGSGLERLASATE